MLTRLAPIIAFAASAATARSQVVHTYVEEWTSNQPTNVEVGGHGSQYVPAVVNPWPSVMGWWTNAGWPIIRAESTTVIDFVVPPDPSGAPVEYGWDSFLRLQAFSDAFWDGYIENDASVSTSTTGGLLPTPVHWESIRELVGWGEYIVCECTGGVSPRPARVCSQVSSPGAPWGFDAWIGPPLARVPANANISVSTRVTATWTFTPSPITAWGAGDIGCGGVPNSTGAASRLEMGGSPNLADDSIFVSAWDLPPSSWAILAASAEAGATSPGTSTSLCLVPASTSIHRVAVLQATAAGEIAWRLPRAQFPLAFGPYDQRMHFQLWHRDATPAGSNVSNAYRVRYF